VAVRDGVTRILRRHLDRAPHRCLRSVLAMMGVPLGGRRLRRDERADKRKAAKNCAYTNGAAAAPRREFQASTSHRDARSKSAAGRPLAIHAIHPALCLCWFRSTLATPRHPHLLFRDLLRVHSRCGPSICSPPYEDSCPGGLTAPVARCPSARSYEAESSIASAGLSPARTRHLSPRIITLPGSAAGPARGFTPVQRISVRCFTPILQARLLERYVSPPIRH
jgi:hypothetical protein